MANLYLMDKTYVDEWGVSHAVLAAPVYGQPGLRWPWCTILDDSDGTLFTVSVEALGNRSVTCLECLVAEASE